jgi:hypothetical protein
MRVFLETNLKTVTKDDLNIVLEQLFHSLEDQLNGGPDLISLVSANDKLPRGSRAGDLVFSLIGGEIRVGVYNGEAVTFASFGSFTGALTDVQHGDRGGGTLHALATQSLAGFLSATDKLKLDQYLGQTSSTAAPTTTEYPANGDWGFHNNTVAGTWVIARNVAGTIITVGGSTGGVTAFTGLSDVPSAYTGAASKFVAVKADMSGLEFVASPSAYPTGTTTFTWVSNGDENGVIFFLGRRLNTQPFFENPHAKHVYTVRSSDGAGTSADITDRQPNTTYSNSVANSWWAIDLGSGRTIKPAKYSLRNYASTLYMRNWKLQGCNSVATNDVAGIAAATWVDLDSQVNNTTIVAGSGWVTITMTPPVTGYRWLRVLCNGVDSGGNNYCLLAEFEVYGAFTY